MTRRALVALVAGLLGTSTEGCTSVDPGDNFVVPNQVFDRDYFYCVVLPKYIEAYKCGPGDPSKGDNGNCHFSSSVTGMAMQPLTQPITCAGDHPADISQLDSKATGEYEAVAFEMTRDYTTAPVYVRPLGNSHPRAVITSGDMTVSTILSTWASK